MQLDGDGNGELSQDELAKLPARAQEMVKRIDRNEDGALSKEELNQIGEGQKGQGRPGGERPRSREDRPQA
jgi:hypothetical protein